VTAERKATGPREENSFGSVPAAGENADLTVGGSVMSLSGFFPWLTNALARLREKFPAWPPLIGFDGLDAEPDEERRWIEEERRLLPYLYWPNI
jgi:hypothetical protein